MSELESKIQAISEDVNNVAQQAAGIVVKTESDVRTATNFLSQVKKRIKRIETLRKEFLEPFQAGVKNINNKFKLQSEPLKEIERLIKESIKTFIDEQEKIQMEKQRKEEAERKKLEEEREKQLAEGKKVEALPEKKEMVKEEKTMYRAEEGATIVKKVWKFYVEDVSKVPNEYLLIDEVKIRAAIGAGERDIKGVKIYQDNQITIR